MNPGLAIIVGLVLVLVDRAIHSACHKSDPLSGRCRLALFGVGFAMFLVPVAVLIGVHFPMVLLLIIVGLFTGFSNSLSIDIQRAYLRKRKTRKSG